MSRSRKYHPPYTRKPDAGLLAADALWDEARAEDARLEAELAAMRLEIADEADAYEFGGPL
jgi:hypothetical protein